MSTLAPLRCPACRQEIHFDDEWRETLSESQRVGVEWHISKSHADKITQVREHYLTEISAVPTGIDALVEQFTSSPFRSDEDFVFAHPKRGSKLEAGWYQLLSRRRSRQQAL